MFSQLPTSEGRDKLRARFRPNLAPLPVYEITPEHAFLVAIDSDGCVFDSMELKHKECFVPEFILHYALQSVSRLARETWEFVNLYSQSRGLNRFPALVDTLDRLSRRPEVRARMSEITVPPSLRDWVKQEKRLGNPALEARFRETNDPALAHCLEWSQAVNHAIDRMVHNLGPFPSVRDCLKRLAPQADLIVCSATPTAALQKEWAEHQIDRYVSQICGQEVGTKKEILATASKWAPDHVLMIGDAPGDYAAAAANACLFFPINPGDEEASWAKLSSEGIDRFLTQTFRGEYQTRLLDEFNRRLPQHPTWKIVE